MPVYTYSCPSCKKRFEVFKRIANLERREDSPCCHLEAQRVVTATLAVRGMFEPYISEASGKVISSPSQRRDDLARTGCIEYDPEMRKDVQRVNEEAERKLDQTLDAALGETLHHLGA